MFKNLFKLKAYLVGEYGSTPDGNVTWAVVGLYSTVDKAMAACISENYFYIQIVVDEPFKPNRIDWVYPIQLNKELTEKECDCGETCGENCECEVQTNE